MNEIAGELLTLAQIVGALGIILTPVWLGIFWFYKKVFSPIHSLIKKELTPNGGKSMRDEIITINTKVDRMLLTQEEINERLDGHFLWSRAFTKKMVTGEVLSDADLEAEQRRA